MKLFWYLIRFSMYSILIMSGAGAATCTQLLTNPGSSFSAERSTDAVVDRWLNNPDQGFNFSFKNYFEHPSWASNKFKIRDVANRDGDLILFRYIRGEYQKNFRGHYALMEEGYSYSLIPYEEGFDDGAEEVNSVGTEYILVSQENVIRDRIYSPYESTGTLSFESCCPYADEIKVPLDREHPLLVIPAEAFATIHRQVFGAKGDFTVNSLVNELLKSPQVKLIR